MSDDTPGTSSLELATELTIAWLANPNTKATADDVPNFLRTIHAAVTGLAAGDSVSVAEPSQPTYEPAVTVRKSLASKDHIISLIDGKPYKSLRKHLTGHGLTPEEYRERYGLKIDYPMVSESYSQVRREMAKKLGLGRKPGQRPSQASATGGKTTRSKTTK